MTKKSNAFERAAQALSEVKELVQSGHEVISAIESVRDQLESHERSIAEHREQTKRAHQELGSQYAESNDALVASVTEARSSVESAVLSVKDVHANLVDASNVFARSAESLDDIESLVKGVTSASRDIESARNSIDAAVHSVETEALQARDARRQDMEQLLAAGDRIVEVGKSCQTVISLFADRAQEMHASLTKARDDTSASIALVTELENRVSERLKEFESSLEVRSKQGNRTSWLIAVVGIIQLIAIGALIGLVAMGRM